MFFYAVKIDYKSIKLDNLLFLIDDEKKIKIHKFKKYEDQCRGVFSEILIRYALCNELKISSNKIQFDKGEFGKPYLLGNEGFHFNLSHSGEWVVCVVDDKPMGVDIEQIQNIEYKELANNFFTQKEINFILNSKTDEQLLNFYRMWTLKESYIKADGRGMTIPLNSFSVIINNDNINIETNNILKKVYFKEFHIDKDYKMSVCSLNDILTNEVIIMSNEELIENYRNLLDVSK